MRHHIAVACPVKPGVKMEGRRFHLQSGRISLVQIERDGMSEGRERPEGAREVEEPALPRGRVERDRVHSVPITLSSSKGAGPYCNATMERPP